MKFRTTIVQTGKTATGIPVPPDIVSSLGTSKRPAVCVTINGYTYRSTVAPMGGEFWLPVSAEVRGHAGVASGDEVEIGVELDTEPRTMDVPDELAVALATASVRPQFDSLSYSNQRRIIEPILSAKTEETRQRRIEKAVASFQEGTAR